MRMKALLALIMIAHALSISGCGGGKSNGLTDPQQSSTILAAGRNHAVTLKNDGIIWTWGNNYYGQLGDATTTNRNTPVHVIVSSGITTVPFSGATAVAAGNDFSVALRNDGTIWAWGDNYYGQLGDGTTIYRNTPVQVVVSSRNTTIPFSGARAVAAGDGFTVALKNDGTVWAWGVNWYGQLGDGTTANRNTPVQVTGLSGVVAIAAGSSNTVALKNDGTVWNWGDNANGELGVGRDFINSHIFPNSSTPVQVMGLSGVVAVASGDRSTVALKNDGTVWTWGANWYGQLGDGTTIDRYLPVQVLELSGVTAISAGFQHSLALKNDSTVWAWGVNWYGQLGDGTTSDRSTPVRVNYNNDTALTGVVSISAGDGLSAALKNDGTVWAWGANYSGQLGDGTTTDKYNPEQITTASTYTITPSAGAHGSISPNTPQAVNGRTTFTVTPDNGYIASVIGCGGTLVGNTYTTGLITDDCTVPATFFQ